MAEPALVYPITCTGYRYQGRQRTARRHTPIRLVAKKEQQKVMLCHACEAELHILAMHGGTLDPDHLHIDIIEEIRTRTIRALDNPELFTEDERTYLKSILI